MYLEIATLGSLPCIPEEDGSIWTTNWLLEAEVSNDWTRCASTMVCSHTKSRRLGQIHSSAFNSLARDKSTCVSRSLLARQNSPQSRAFRLGLLLAKALSYGLKMQAQDHQNVDIFVAVPEYKTPLGPQTPSWERDLEHDLSRSCYPQSSVDVREEPEYHNIESTRVVARQQNNVVATAFRREQHIPEDLGGRMMCSGLAGAASML